MTSTPPTSPSNGLQKTETIMREFQQLDPTMQITTALVLLLVAKHQDREGGLSTQDIAKMLDAPSGSISLNTYYWAEGT